MQITIDEQKCVGCGRCTELCPEIFKLSENGKATVTKTEDNECAMKAADECPVEAIFVDE